MDPCILCRHESMSVGSGYCKDCLLNNILEKKRIKYPISVKDLEDRWNQD